MNPKGNDVADAIKEWMKSELIHSPQKKYELGKFFFGVSSSTLGIIVGLAKFSKIQFLSFTLVLSIILFVISILIALIMVLPKLIKISGEVDLFTIHEKIIRFTRFQIYIWFLLWSIGVIIGIIAILI